MSEAKRLRTDRKKLAEAEAALARGRDLLAGPGGDATWGPIIGRLGVAVDVLRRRLNDLEATHAE